MKETLQQFLARAAGADKKISSPVIDGRQYIAIVTDTLGDFLAEVCGNRLAVTETDEPTEGTSKVPSSVGTDLASSPEVSAVDTKSTLDTKSTQGPESIRGNESTESTKSTRGRRG